MIQLGHEFVHDLTLVWTIPGQFSQDGSFSKSLNVIKKKLSGKY